MPDQQLQAVITAIDKASATLQKIANEGDKMGKSLDNAGKTGARSMDDLNRRMAAAGAAFTATGAILGQWARNAQDAAAIQRQLEQAIANTGESFSTYASQIQAAQAQAVQLGIDDEKAAQAIQALTEITGNAGTALSLLGTAEDLSAAKGMDLVTAAELIGKVHEGNVGILQRYGVVVQQGATAEQALAQIQQQTAGQAEAHATTYARLREELSNLTDTIGGAVGGFAPFLQVLPGLSSGFSLVGAAVGALVPELTAATAATALLDAALGPVGLVVAAGAAFLAIQKLTSSHDDEAAAAKRAADATQSLADTVAKLSAGGASGAAAATQQFYDLQGALVDLNNQIDVLNDKIPKVRLREGADAVKPYEQELKELELAQKATVKAQEDLNKILADTGTGAGIALAKTKALFDEYERSAKTADDLAKLEFGLGTVAAMLSQYDIEANRAAQSTKALAAAQDRQASAQQKQADTIAFFAQQQQEAATEAMFAYDQATTGLDDYAHAAQANTQALAAQAAAQKEGAKAAVLSLIATRDLTVGQQTALSLHTAIVGAMGEEVAELEAQAKAAYDAAKALGVLSTYAQQLRPVDLAPRGGDKATGVAADLQKTGSALDSVLGIFSTLDGMNRQAQAAGSIAENLVGKPGEVAEIDQLLAEGRISQTRYNQTVEAGYRIQQRAASVERDLAVIRAKQMPLLDQQDQAYARQIDKLSHMDAVQQEVTLGFMDQAESMKAQQAVTLAASAAMGELGDRGEATATKIIQGAAEADPVLKEMLKSIGLVTEDKEGNIKVNFPEAESLTEAVDALSSSIDGLTAALGLVPPTTTADVQVTGTDTAEGNVEGVHAALTNLPDSVSAAIFAIDNASGTIAGVSTALDALNGKTAVVTTINNTINNVTDVHSSVSGVGTIGLRDGGVVPYEVPHASARGGTVTRGMTRVTVGEAGREDVLLPGGAYVRNAAATAAATGGGQVILNQYFTGAVNATSIDDLMASAARAARAHFAGLGI